MSKLYIIATPIGNLEDITLRALRILKESDFVLCEDTRVTKKLLDHYDIDTPTISYHQHSSGSKIKEIISLLEGGKTLALVTDAGTPGISDPGNELVEQVIEKLGNDVKIEPIPGPSALIVAASISGMPMNKFVFMGFPPHKNKRNKFFEEIFSQSEPVIIYESAHRIVKALEQMSDIIFKKGENYGIVVARELTKKFETIYRGNIDEVLEAVKNDKVKGEFVIVINKSKLQNPNGSTSSPS